MKRITVMLLAICALAISHLPVLATPCGFSASQQLYNQRPQQRPQHPSEPGCKWPLLHDGSFTGSCDECWVETYNGPKCNTLCCLSCAVGGIVWADTALDLSRPSSDPNYPNGCLDGPVSNVHGRLVCGER